MKTETLRTASVGSTDSSVSSQSSRKDGEMTLNDVLALEAT
ncbi:MAG: hypothetical protein ACW98Y_15580 [Candidatus Thorarchaeota archaeon]|jgi:hypothetical protein